jgi:Protein of unknown function (DUF1344)
MRKSLVIAAVAASMISTAAFAAADTGAIKVIDAAKHQLSLADGKVFELPAAWKPTGFKVGDKVTVTYEMKNGKMEASAVAHAS